MKNININITEENYKKLENFKDDICFQNLWNTIQSIKKQSILYYDLSDDNEKEEYFQKYISTIFELIMSFNSFLLKKYIQKNKEKTIDVDWVKIYKRKSSQNNFMYLIKQHIEYFEDYLFIIHSLYLWENLFRHQLAHGWIDIFKVILSKNDLYLFIDKNFLSQNFDNSHLLSGNVKNTINELREYLKEQSITMSFNKELINKNISNINGVLELTFLINIKNPDFFLIDVEKDILKQNNTLQDIDTTLQDIDTTLNLIDDNIEKIDIEKENLIKRKNELLNLNTRVKKNLEKLLIIKERIETTPKEKMRMSLNTLLVDIWSILTISYNHIK